MKENNSDEATLHVIDVATGKVSDVDVIEGGKYASASWTPDGSGFYYTWLPTDPKIPVDERPGYPEVRFHRLGEDPKKDRVVHGRLGDPTAFVAAGISRDGRWLVLSVQHGWTSTDVYFRDLADPEQADRWTPLVVGTEAHWSVEVFSDRFYVTTDDGAPQGRVFAVDPAPARAEGVEGGRPRAARRDARPASVLGGRLALNYLKDASSLLEVRELDGTLVREVKLPGLGTVGGPVGPARRGRGVLLVRVLHDAARDLLDVDEDGRGTSSTSEAEGPGRPVAVRRRAGLLPVEGRDAASRCSSSTGRT